jgi:DmsE family decaheme c-type cytochrome
MVKKTSELLMAVVFLPLLLASAAATKEHKDSQAFTATVSICFACHDDRRVSLENSPHRVSPDKKPAPSMAAGCVSCHDGWQKHLDNPSAESIDDLKTHSLKEQADLCGRCHLSIHQTLMASGSPHARADITCLSCHTIHDNPDPMLLREDSKELCTACHLPVAAEFKRRSAHPVESGNILCIDCHHLDVPEESSPRAGFDWSCQECHGDLAGPYLYEHRAVYSYHSDGKGCLECHNPHGSANDHLLTQPGDGLCLQCHIYPSGHRQSHGGLAARLVCIDCHSDVHGSDDNRLLLDPDLGLKLYPDCYQSGCHIIDD